MSDAEELGLDNLAQILLLDWLSQVFGILGVAAGKVSVSALLLSMLRDTALQWHRLYLWFVTIGLSSAIATSCSILTMSQCSPPRALWDSRVDGQCIDSNTMSSYGIFTGGMCSHLSETGHQDRYWNFRNQLTLLPIAFNTFADGSLAILPVTIFWKLSTNRLYKVQLTVVFGLNILACICSGIKTQYLAELANRTDLTWATFDIFAYVTIELFLIIVCGTLPTLYPLFGVFQSTIGALKSKFFPCKATNSVGYEGPQIGETMGIKVQALMSW